MFNTKLDFGQLIQIATFLIGGASAWYSLSTDMALIKQRLDIDGVAAQKVENRLNTLEERVTNVENTQRDLWHDVRSSSGKR